MPARLLFFAAVRHARARAQWAQGARAHTKRCFNLIMIVGPTFAAVFPSARKLFACTSLLSSDAPMPKNSSVLHPQVDF